MSSKWLYHSQRWYKQQLVVQKYYMNKDKHIPQGYKNSPLGIIPKEWEVKRLGDIADITSGTTPLRANSKYYDNGIIPWVKTTDLNNGTLFETEEKVSEEAVKKTSLKLLPKGTVLVAMYGGFRQIGRTAILGIDATINQALSALICKDYVSSSFVLAWLNCRVNYWKRLAASSRKDPNITGNEVAKFPILIPSKKEQDHIVKVLGLWDTAIEKQSELTEKLTLRKRALMQKLLTGKKRLPRFSEKWKRMTINEFAKEVSIKNVKSEDCIVLSCTKYDGLVPSLEYFGKQIYSNDLRNYKIVPRNHFVYATNHIEEGSIGYQTDYEKGLISPMYTVFYTDENIVDDSFLFAILKSHHFIYLYQSMMEGSINRRGGLRWDSFSTIKIDLPPLNEQKAISAFLKDLDKEIELANEKLAKLKSQKRGLMQQLLTGKKRIK